jgi:hypothetical protein
LETNAAIDALATRDASVLLWLHQAHSVARMLCLSPSLSSDHHIVDPAADVMKRFVLALSF